MTTATADGDAMERVCPRCGARFRGNQRFCPSDAAPLLLVEATENLIGTVVSERYVIIRKLGEGGMGEVFLADDVRVGRPCAVKFIRPELRADPDAVARFHREAKHASRIVHPSLAAVYDVGEAAGGRFFIVMEFVDGESLAVRLAREMRLQPRPAVRVALGVAAALSAAHRVGIVHRDVKPENVLLVANSDRVKLLDLGIARAMSSDSSLVTSTSRRLGTPRYMSPEQVAGESVDLRSDVYALGLLTFNVLTGRLPFADSGPNDFLMRVTSPAHSLAHAAPDVAWPNAMTAVLARVLERDPAARYQDVQEFAEALVTAFVDWDPDATNEFLALLAVAGGDVYRGLGTPSSMTGPRRTARRWRWTTGSSLANGRIGVAAIVALVGVGAVESLVRQRSAAAEVPRLSGVEVLPGIPAASTNPVLGAPVDARGGAAPRETTPDPVKSPKRQRVPTVQPLEALGTSATTSTRDSSDFMSRGRTPPGSREQTQKSSPPTVLIISSRTPGAFLYLNQRMIGPLVGAREVKVEPGPLEMSLRAERCQSWDTIAVVRSGETLRLGIRDLNCIARH